MAILRKPIKHLPFVLLVLGISGFAICGNAASGDQLWIQRFSSGSDVDEPYAIALDQEGNVFVTGSSSSGVVAASYTTLKYSNVGVPMWTNRYVGPWTGGGPGGARALAIDHNQNVVVTGYSPDIEGNPGWATIKYSNTGEPLWTNLYPAYGTALAVDASGNVIVTGLRWHDGLRTVKYSSHGTPLWTNTYLGAPVGDDRGNAIAVDSTGNVFVAGAAARYQGTDPLDFLTLAYSSDGIPLWTNIFNGDAFRDDEARAMKLDQSGNVFATGSASISSGASFGTFKYSNGGTPLWTNYHRDSAQVAEAMTLDSAGDVIIIGGRVIIKYSSEGVPLWTNNWQGPSEFTRAVGADKNGHVFVTGNTLGNSLDNDILTIAYSGAGLPLWSNRYNGPANKNDSSSAIALDAGGNVFVTGLSTGTNRIELVTIKYAALQSIPLTLVQSNNSVVLSWSDPAFRLQTAESFNGTFTNIWNATSPHTVPVSGAQQFFRLKLD